MATSIFTITVIRLNEEFVWYSYSVGGKGVSGRKWFPNVAVGQVWKMECRGAIVIRCIRA
jgi:hypothetical protein